jgi:hypothetical protein
MKVFLLIKILVAHIKTFPNNIMLGHTVSSFMWCDFCLAPYWGPRGVPVVGRVSYKNKKNNSESRCCYAKIICRDCRKVLLRFLNVGIEFGINSFQNPSGPDDSFLSKITLVQEFLSKWDSKLSENFLQTPIFPKLHWSNISEKDLVPKLRGPKITVSDGLKSFQNYSVFHKKKTEIDLSKKIVT